VSQCDCFCACLLSFLGFELHCHCRQSCRLEGRRRRRFPRAMAAEVNQAVRVLNGQPSRCRGVGIHPSSSTILPQM
jgi:hypothetical protein